MGELQEVIELWGDYIAAITDWQRLIKDITPKPSGCGPIYEMPNPIAHRPNEDFCIADMRKLKVAEPHYHPEGVTEIYFVIQGSGTVIVGNDKHAVSKGSVVVMPPHTAHYTIPEDDLVLGVVNTPPFQPDQYMPVHQTDLSVKFDKDLFDRLSAAAV